MWYIHERANQMRVTQAGLRDDRKSCCRVSGTGWRLEVGGDASKATGRTRMTWRLAFHADWDVEFVIRMTSLVLSI